MGDILAVIFAVTFFLVFAFACVTLYRHFIVDPPKNLSPDTEYYRIAQQAVRLLEALLRDEMVKGVIRQKDRDEMQSTIDNFYSL